MDPSSVVGRVVSAAGEDGIIFVLHFQFDLAVASIVLLVGGGVADSVLAAQFFRDLIECLLQVLFAAHDNHPPASLVGEPLGDDLVATIGGNQKNMDNSIGSLRGFDGVLQLQFASRIFRVGQDNDGFSARFIGQLVVGGEVNGVVKIRPACAARGKGTLDKNSADRDIY